MLTNRKIASHKDPLNKPSKKDALIKSCYEIWKKKSLSVHPNVNIVWGFFTDGLLSCTSELERQYLRNVLMLCTSNCPFSVYCEVRECSVGFPEAIILRLSLYLDKERLPWSQTLRYGFWEATHLSFVMFHSKCTTSQPSEVDDSSSLGPYLRPGSISASSIDVKSRCPTGSLLRSSKEGELR